MDLLDSILGSMDKPPTIKKPEIKDKEKREKFEKMQRERSENARKHKEMLNKFRVDISKKLQDFVNTPTTDDARTNKWKLKPMNKIFRTIVREACEEHEDEVVVHSFGIEEQDRHCIIWKRGFEPCDDEIRAMKAGVEYKPKVDIDEDPIDSEPNSSKTTEGKDKFWSKYEKIIGENASGVESARIALPAKQYGCVPIENKRDQRSIEQMIDDLRKSKKQKTENIEDQVENQTQSTSAD